jgi:hypothetical protein
MILVSKHTESPVELSIMSLPNNKLVVPLILASAWLPCHVSLDPIPIFWQVNLPPPKYLLYGFYKTISLDCTNPLMLVRSLFPLFPE